MTGSFDRAAAAVAPLDAGAMADAAALQARLTKPAGALGRLEALGIRLAGIAGACPPPLPSPGAVAVFAGDHGVVARGVTPWPQEVTAQMISNFLAGGAAINVLARQVGATVVVVDVGVATSMDHWPERPLGAGSTGPERPLRAGKTVPERPPGAGGATPGFLRRNVRAGTADLMAEAAMTQDEARTALDVGCDVAAELVAGGARCLITGEMGIGNTTPSAALIAAFTGRPPTEVTGRGTGIDDATLAHKGEIVAAALEMHAGAVAAGPLATIAALGGLEIVALAGFIVGGAAAGVPVLVDGVVADAALLAAAALAPGVEDRCIAGHLSTEPGAAAALAHLGLEPLLDLGLRLGEGSGACLALPLVEAAARIVAEMATFDSAGVSDKHP